MSYNPNAWYWIVDGSTTQVYCGATSAYVAISDATYQAWLAAGNVPTKIIGDDMLKLRIDLLEAQQTPRRIREAAAGVDGGWMQNLNSQIAALRSQLT